MRPEYLPRPSRSSVDGWQEHRLSYAITYLLPLNCGQMSLRNLQTVRHPQDLLLQGLETIAEVCRKARRGGLSGCPRWCAGNVPSGGPSSRKHRSVSLRLPGLVQFHFGLCGGVLPVRGYLFSYRDHLPELLVDSGRHGLKTTRFATCGKQVHYRCRCRPGCWQASGFRARNSGTPYDLHNADTCHR